MGSLHYVHSFDGSIQGLEPSMPTNTCANLSAAHDACDFPPMLTRKGLKVRGIAPAGTQHRPSHEARSRGLRVWRFQSIGHFATIRSMSPLYRQSSLHVVYPKKGIRVCAGLLNRHF